MSNPNNNQKGEIRDALEEDIKKGAINNVEIQGIFS